MDIGHYLAIYDNYKRNQAFQDCLYTLRIIVGVLGKNKTINKYDYGDALSKLQDFSPVVNKFYYSERDLYAEALNHFQNKEFKKSYELLIKMGNQEQQKIKNNMKQDIKEIDEVSHDEDLMKKELKQLRKILIGIKDKKITLTPDLKGKLIARIEQIKKEIREHDKEAFDNLDLIANSLRSA